MKKNFLFIFLMFLTFQQAISQVSMNMNLLDNWDQAGLNYNDVWGYVDGNGNEYAILGSRSKIHFFSLGIITFLQSARSSTSLENKSLK